MDRNKKRVMVIIVVIFVVVLVFFAGRYSVGMNKPYVRDVNTSASTADDRVGVPPDSLHH